MRLLLLLLAASGLGVAIWLASADPVAPAPATPERGPLPERAEYVGSKTCKECHPDRHESWLETAHAYSLRGPHEGSIEGRFDGTPVEAEFFDATPFRRGGAYVIRVVGKDGRPSGEHTITHVVGRTFEQAYLFTGPKGEWRVLPICWSIERKEWDLTHEVLSDIAGDVEFVNKTYDTRNRIFNHGCGQCHATDYDVGHVVDPAAAASFDTYRTTYLEGAVACETCHGMGSVHVAWHSQERGAGDDYGAPARLLHPKKELDHEQVLDSCGRCHYLHAWRYAIDPDPRVGHHDIAVSNNHDRYGFFADGRLAGLNYHGSTQRQSACFLEGEMSCLSCHRMHSGNRWALKWKDPDSDAQCTQCHTEPGYATARHTHHTDERCLDCHMPRLLGGLLHFMRDHAVRSPEPELSQRFGADQSPNACNACHKDKEAKWAREWKEKWWGPASPRYVRNVETVVSLRKDLSSVATKRLVEMLEDRRSRHFFRMTAAHRLGGRMSDAAARAALLRLLENRDTELVQLACDAFGRFPDRAAAPALLPLLDHEARTVRVEAAYALARCGFYGTSPGMDRAFSDAKKMLDRQRHFVVALERIALLAEASGKGPEADRFVASLLHRSGWRDDAWPDQGIEILHRHARRRAEEGEHAEALNLYAKVREESGTPFPPILFIDSADTLFELGDSRQASGIWRDMVADPERPPVLRAIARARLAALEGPAADAIKELESLEKRLATDPAAGRELRRVRWSLRVMR